MDPGEFKILCYECVGDQILKEKILSSGMDEDCSYCGKNIKCQELAEIADRVYAVFSEIYQPGTSEIAFVPNADSTYWEQQGSPPNVIFMEMMNV